MFDGRTKSFEYLEFGIGRRLFLRSLVLMLLPPSSLALVESNGTDSLLFRDDSDGGLDCIRSWFDADEEVSSKLDKSSFLLLGKSWGIVGNFKTLVLADDTAHMLSSFLSLLRSPFSRKARISLDRLVLPRYPRSKLQIRTPWPRLSLVKLSLVSILINPVESVSGLVRILVSQDPLELLIGSVFRSWSFLVPGYRTDTSGSCSGSLKDLISNLDRFSSQDLWQKRQNPVQDLAGSCWESSSILSKQEHGRIWSCSLTEDLARNKQKRCSKRRQDMAWIRSIWTGQDWLMVWEGFR